MERSLVLIKPDAIQRGLAGEIVSRLEKKGLKIVAMKMLHMDKNLAQRHKLSLTIWWILLPPAQ